MRLLSSADVADRPAGGKRPREPGCGGSSGCRCGEQQSRAMPAVRPPASTVFVWPKLVPRAATRRHGFQRVDTAAPGAPGRATPRSAHPPPTLTSSPGRAPASVDLGQRASAVRHLGLVVAGVHQQRRCRAGGPGRMVEHLGVNRLPCHRDGGAPSDSAARLTSVDDSGGNTSHGIASVRWATAVLALPPDATRHASGRHEQRRAQAVGYTRRNTASCRCSSRPHLSRQKPTQRRAGTTAGVWRITGDALRGGTARRRRRWHVVRAQHPPRSRPCSRSACRAETNLVAAVALDLNWRGTPVQLGAVTTRLYRPWSRPRAGVPGESGDFDGLLRIGGRGRHQSSHDQYSRGPGQDQDSGAVGVRELLQRVRPRSSQSSKASAVSCQTCLQPAISAPGGNCTRGGGPSRTARATPVA